MIWEGTHQVADKVPGAYAYLLLPLGYLALPQVFPAWMWAAATIVQVVVITTLVATTVGVMRRMAAGPAEEHAASPPAAAPAMHPRASAAE